MLWLESALGSQWVQSKIQGKGKLGLGLGLVLGFSVAGFFGT